MSGLNLGGIGTAVGAASPGLQQMANNIQAMPPPAQSAENAQDLAASQQAQTQMHTDAQSAISDVTNASQLDPSVMAGLSGLGAAVQPNFGGAPQHLARGGIVKPAGAIPMAPPNPNRFHDAEHPAWQVLRHMTEPGNAAIPRATQMLEDGGTVSEDTSATHPQAHSNLEILKYAAKDVAGHLFGGGAAAIAAKDAQQGSMSRAIPDSYQNGGPVTARNHGSLTQRPEFTRSPALPVGPNSGIVPASTEGQVLTMDAGGIVPGTSLVQPTAPTIQAAPTQFPSKLQGFTSGFGQGETIGANLQRAWQDNTARRHLAADAATDQLQSNPDTAGDVQGTGVYQSPMEKFQGKVQDFVTHIFNHNIDKTTANSSAPKSNGPADAMPAPPTPQPGVGSAPMAPAPGAAPGAQALPAGAPPAAAGAPAPGPAIPAGAAPAGAPAGAPPAAGAPAGAPPAAAAPAPLPPGQPAQPGQAATGQAAQLQTAASSAIIPQTVKDPVNAATSQKVDNTTSTDSTNAAAPAHSLTPAFYANSNRRIADAMKYGTLAGQDPFKIRDAMIATRTANIQGQIALYGQQANVAVMNNDQAGLKKALANMNYYLPDGQNLKFQTANDLKDAKNPDGTPVVQPGTSPNTLFFRNPYAGMPGHQNDPEFHAADLNTIHSLVINAMDPKQLQGSIQASALAGAQMQKEMMTGQGALLTGEGRRDWGKAQLGKAQLEEQNNDVSRYFKISQGNLNNARADAAATNSGPKVSTAAYKAAGDAASTAVDDLRLGPKVVAPAVDANNIANPNAGKIIHDQSKANPIYAKYGADDVTQVKNLARHLAQANIHDSATGPSVGPEEAAFLAAKAYDYSTPGRPGYNGTHPDPANPQGKPVPNVVPDSGSGRVHIWTGNGWRAVNVTVPPNSVDDRPSGLPGVGNAGEGPAGSTESNSSEEASGEPGGTGE